MADNVSITNGGSAFTAATDEVAVNGGTVAQVQYVKLVDGTANGTAGLPGDGTNGLKVNVTALVPGTGATALGKAEDAAHTDGDVGVMALGVRNNVPTVTDGDYATFSIDGNGNMRVVAHREMIRTAVSVTGVTTATTAYTAGDTVGTIYTIANASRLTGGGGVITGVTLIDQSDIIGAYDVIFFDSTVTLAADNAAFAISDADSLKTVGIAQLAGAFDIGNNRVAQAYNLAIPYVCSGGTSLFAALITRSGHTFFTAGALPQLNVYMERYG